MHFNRLFPAFCLVALCWSCTPSAWFSPVFRPQQGALYRLTVNEVTHTFSVENGERVCRDQNVLLAFHYRVAAPKSLVVGFDAFAFHEKGEKKERNTDLAPEYKDLRCSLDDNGSVDALSGQQNPHIGEGYIASLLEKGWSRFPKHAIKVGDSWTAQDSLNADPHIPLETTYTLLKTRGGILYIQSDADVRLVGEKLVGTTSHGGKLTLSGRQRGILHVDAATGMLLDAQTVLHADGTLQTGTGKIPMHIDSTCSVTAA